MIFLDTDFLVFSIKNNIDFSKQIKEESPKEELAIVDKTLDELTKLNSLESKIALSLIKIKKFKIIKTKKDKIADDLIIDNLKIGDIVATQDKELKKRVIEKGNKVITIRQKRYIKFD